MHLTALEMGKLFFSNYARADWKMIIETGAMDVNGSLRSVAPPACLYLGVDTEFGKSVDVKMQIGEPLPFRKDFADCVLSTSQMEHDDFFWMTFLDMLRVVKPGGYIYINAPSNGAYHRYPNDNWRFYPDCGHVLARWARKNGYELELVESFVSDQKRDCWNDFCVVFVKGSLSEPPSTYLADQHKCRNVWKWRAAKMEKESQGVEDMLIQQWQAERIKELEASVAKLSQAQVGAAAISDDTGNAEKPAALEALAKA